MRKKIQFRKDEITRTPDDFNELFKFSKMLNKSPEIAEAVSKAPSPGLIIEIATKEGFAFSLPTLREYSRELKADHWPWAQKDNNWRNQFFRSCV